MFLAYPGNTRCLNCRHRVFVLVYIYDIITKYEENGEHKNKIWGLSLRF
ncbi:MAG: hypothetical protein UX81_C0002G0004 [Parcubacteria group bacterium GW2011_GWA2_47_12]|nr:MAG: hypothetical protein UX81_C0002G0004 [Parcubacteria group bacterium GW2011_GWA2_47_12]